MTTPGLFKSSKGPLGFVLTGCALTGIFLMGVPCAHDHGGPTQTGSGPLPEARVTGSFTPSNAHVDPSISAQDAATLTLEGIDGTFVFSGGQRWLEYEDGSARLEAELTDVGDRHRRFGLELKAVDRRFASDLGPAAFHLALPPGSYKAGGGTIDPDRWSAFARFAGKLTGKQNLEGTDLTIELVPQTVLQVGEGANGVNSYYGASARLLWHRAAGDSVPTGGEASVSFTLQADTVSRAMAARSEEPYHGSGQLHAVTLPGIAQRMVFSAGGQLTERPDGTARLSGVLVDLQHPGRSFHMDVRLSGRIAPGDAAYPPTGSPKLELRDAAYASLGGPVDPDTWTYYEEFQGTLLGLGEFRGAELLISRRGPAFQFGNGASGKNERSGGAGWLNTLVVTQPLTGPALEPTIGGDINIELDTSGTASCASAALQDTDLSHYSGGHAFWIPGFATDLVFEPGAMFVEKADGTARLEGVIYSWGDPSIRLLAGVDFADRIDPQGPGYPPATSPKLELTPGAYVDAGGAVYPGGWHYYTNTLGELTGLGRLRGARLQIERRGPAFQVGLGASGKNDRQGASGWLEVTVTDQPKSGPALPPDFDYGDINVDLGDDCSTCAVSAFYDGEVAQYRGSHSFYLPGISHDFVFEPGASFVERSDGTARLSGWLMSPSRPGWRFRAAVDLTDRVDPGDPSHPPTGSPKRELIPASFAEQGGPIDTGSWRYYETFSGRLEGVDALAGAVVAVERFGPPFQVGPGADGKNHRFGGAGWIDVVLLEQPTTGVGLPSLLARGDINLDFTDGCMECVTAAPRDAAISLLPGSAAFYFAGLGSGWFNFEGPAEFTERADGTATLKGVLHDVAGGDQRWALDLGFGALSSPLDGDALPRNSPKRDFIPSHYVDQGGPTDFMAWRYYQTTAGELIGLGQHAGARVRLGRMGPSTQVGRGASGANESFGASGWLTTELLSQPDAGPGLCITSGDFNIDVGGDCGICATPAMLDENATSTSGDHAFYFPGIGTDFIFDGPAPFEEFIDGTARLTGEIYRPEEPNKRFRVEVDFSGRVDPGTPAYPPSESPKLELHTPYYVQGGGFVDPSAWRYYEHFEGRAFGLAALEGAVLEYSRMGPSFQIGLGASGKNVDFGAAGWFDVQVVQQPTQGPSLTLTPGFHGDINLNFDPDCGE